MKLPSISTILFTTGTMVSVAQDDPVDFNHDVRPILTKNCTTCHGGVKKAGDVSYLYREDTLGKGESGKTIVVPGDPDASEIIRRIISTDPDDRGSPVSLRYSSSRFASFSRTSACSGSLARFTRQPESTTIS